MSVLDLLKVKEFEKQCGDNFYVFHDEILEKNIKDLNKSFKRYYSNFKIGYSVKTNYTPLICKTSCNKGTYAEIVSPMELEIVKGMGIKGSNIIYNGPIKDYESLLYCLQNKSKINVDHAEELKLLKLILSQNPDLQADIGVRVNLDLEDGSFSRFGYDVGTQAFQDLIKDVDSLEQLTLVGIHFHATKNDKSTDSYLKRLDGLFSIITNHQVFQNLVYLDLGGGFYGPMDENIKSQFNDIIPTYKDYGKVIGTKMKEFFSDEKVELIIEPGLALLVNTLDFYTKAKYKKQIRNKTIIGVSGSFYDVKPSGHKRNLTMGVLTNNRNEKNKDEGAMIVGFTCLENDILYEGYTGPSINVDDYIVFKNLGAYTLVFRPPFIKLSPPIISRNGTKILRKQERFKDVFNSFNFS